MRIKIYIEMKNIEETLSRFMQTYKYLLWKGIVEKQQDVVDIMGYAKATVSSAFNGNKRNFTDNFVKRYVQSFNNIFNVEWILNGEGNMLINEEGVNNISLQKYSEYKEGRVYEVNYADNAASASFIESLYGEEREVVKIPVILKEDEVEYKDELYVFDVRGDSMEPQIHNGDKLLGRKIAESKWEYLTGVAVIVYGKIETIKRISSNRLFGDNTLVLSADNKKYGDDTIERRSIRGMFHVIRTIEHKII